MEIFVNAGKSIDHFAKIEIATFMSRIYVLNSRQPLLSKYELQVPN